MYERKTVTLAEAKIGVEAAIKWASERRPDRPMAVAVVDDRGELICLERMDGAQKLYGDMAYKKAYTAAQSRRDTRNLLERLREVDISVSDGFGVLYTIIPGGQLIAKEGTPPQSPEVYGAIGASGSTGDEDEAMAIAGLEAIKSVLWPSK